MRRQLLLFTCVVLSALACTAMADDRWLNIVYIGNSITEGGILPDRVKDAPPVKTSLYLQKQPGIGGVKYSNQGVSGATTVDFLPETNTCFAKVVDAANQLKQDSWATLIFSISLGTNDSAIQGPNGSPVSKEQYYTNLMVIVDELIKRYPDCKVIIQCPVWYSPNTYNTAMYLKAGLERLKSYREKIEKLVEACQTTHPEQVFLGDTDAFAYFEQNYLNEYVAENGNAGTFYLHPNVIGSERLAEFWGKAILRIIKN